MNEFIVVSIGFQMNESKPSQFNDSRNESLKIRVSQSWLLAANVRCSVSHDQIPHVGLVNVNFGNQTMPKPPIVDYVHY